MGITLTGQVGEQYIKKEFSDVSSIHIGRDYTYFLVRTGLVLEDPFVSGIHCVIDYDAGNYSIRDLASRNGTHVNGRQITNAKKLEDGDRLKLGNTLVDVNITGEN